MEYRKSETGRGGANKARMYEGGWPARAAVGECCPSMVRVLFLSRYAHRTHVRFDRVSRIRPGSRCCVRLSRYCRMCLAGSNG